MRRFEDSVAWQKARTMTSEVYRVTRAAPFARDFGLSSQLQRASTSVMANIAEGFELYGDNQFHHALSIAKGSCGEVRSHLYVALDAGYLSREEFDQLYALNAEVGDSFRPYGKAWIAAGRVAARRLSSTSALLALST